MTDANVLLRYWLLSCQELLDALGGPRIYLVNLPQGYDPIDGPAVTIFGRGGSAHLEAPLISPSLDVKVWCNVDEFVKARKIYGIIFDFIHAATNVPVADYGYILLCEEQVQGIDGVDQPTGWAIVSASFGLRIRNTVEDLVFLIDGGTF